MYKLKNKLHSRQRRYKNNTLRTIALDVTSKCNMNCAHCYADTFANYNVIDLKPLKKCIDEAYLLGVHHYVLQGGEPITDMDRLEKIIEIIYPEETYINVVSNGWDMDRNAVRYLKRQQVDKIAFSLDSGIKEEHDINRRSGSFDRVLQAIENVLAEGLLTSISTVVTRDSLYKEGFKRALGFALNKRIRIDVQIAMPVGKWDGKKDILIRPEDAAYIRKLRDDLPVLDNGQRFINRDIYNFGGADHCPAGTEFMAITANGEILPCNFCQFTLGNVENTSLKSARKLLIKSPWFNGKHPRCLLGEDSDFFDLFVQPYIGVRKPLDACKLLNLNSGDI